MSDNEFIQDDHKPKNSIAGTSTSDDQATQIDGKKSGYLARFSQLFDRKKSPGQNTDKSIKPVEEGDKKSSPIGLIIAGGIIAFVLILGLILAFAFGGRDTPEQVAQPIPEQDQEFEESPPQQEQAAPADTRDYFVAHSVRAGLPADHWAKAADPIGTLTTQAIDSALVKLPEWNPTVSGLNITSTVTYPGDSFEFAQLKSQAATTLGQAIANDVQIHNDPQGQPVILERSKPEAMSAGAPEFDVIKSASAYDTIAINAEMLATHIWSEVIAQARLQLPPPAPDAQALPQQQQVDSGISQAQRAEYNRLLQEADAWQKELIRENQRYKEEMAKQQKQMIEVLQKVEDNSVASANIRAQMISTATDMKVQAIQGDLIFLEDKQGQVRTYRIGDTLLGTGLVISNADSGTGLVYVTNK